MSKMTPEELMRVRIERNTHEIFSRDDARSAVLNACRYLDKNGGAASFSESAIDLIVRVSLCFAAGELDWVKELEDIDD